MKQNQCICSCTRWNNKYSPLLNNNDTHHRKSLVVNIDGWSHLITTLPWSIINTGCYWSITPAMHIIRGNCLLIHQLRSLDHYGHGMFGSFSSNLILSQSKGPINSQTSHSPAFPCIQRRYLDIQRKHTLRGTGSKFIKVLKWRIAGRCNRILTRTGDWNNHGITDLYAKPALRDRPLTSVSYTDF